MLYTNYNELSPTEAIALQQELRGHTQLVPLQYEIKTIGGADISFNKYSETVYAGIVVLSYPELTVLHKASTTSIVKFPYVPGLLAFREVPALVEVWNKLDIKPDVLVLDGHGIAHPRRMGIATHFGLIEGVPTIGCAKSLLVGKHDILANEKFSTTDLIDKGEKIGELLRTKHKCNPVYVSPGHLITMQESIDIIKSCTGKYRMPEPTRLAHLLVNEVRKAAGEKLLDDNTEC
jgi:deoxyribonuclease V